jgi:AcrR family transcriptional regulator
MQPVRHSRPSPRIERTQQALLEALLELIVEQGYERTTVEDILRRADVGRTAFYSHFANKQDLLLNRFSVIPWIRRDADGAFDATFLFGHLADERQLVAAFRGSPAFDDAVATLQQTLLATFTQMLQDQPGTSNSGLDRQLAAQALTGALMQLVLWWIEAEMPESPATMASWFRQFSVRIADER